MRPDGKEAILLERRSDGLLAFIALVNSGVPPDSELVRRIDGRELDALAEYGEYSLIRRAAPVIDPPYQQPLRLEGDEATLVKQALRRYAREPDTPPWVVPIVKRALRNLTPKPKNLTS